MRPVLPCAPSARLAAGGTYAATRPSPRCSERSGMEEVKSRKVGPHGRSDNRGVRLLRSRVDGPPADSWDAQFVQIERGKKQ